MPIQLTDRQYHWLNNGILLLYIVFSLWALGYAIPGAPGKLQAAIGIHVVVLFFFLRALGRCYSRATFVWVTVPWFLLCWFYLPQGVLLGRVSFGMMGALLETNPQESLEYIQNFPWYIYVLLLAYPALFYATVRSATARRGGPPSPRQRRLVWWLLAVMVLTTVYQPVNQIIRRGGAQGNAMPAHYLMTLTGFYPARAVMATTYYVRRHRMEQTQLAREPSWQIMASRPAYKNYVLIVGESMRRDYMSAYGYPWPSTPFLERVPGVVLDNYVAAAPSTIPSLERTLYRTIPTGGGDVQIEYGDNILSLARAGHFQTWWLSNQNGEGIWDIAANRLARQAHFQYSTKNHSFDSALLAPLQQALRQPSQQPRLIVMHLMGSHPVFCNRLEHGRTLNLFDSERMSCYVESILQTDRLIERVHDLLQQAGEPWSVVYFGDHGLSAHKGSNSLSHGDRYQSNYAVPFIRFDSDSQQRIRIAAARSGLDFMGGFASWLGIEERQLSRQPDFYSEQPRGGKVQVYNWRQLVDFDTLPSDPPQLPQYPQQ